MLNAFDKPSFRALARQRLRENAPDRSALSGRIWERLCREFPVPALLRSGKLMVYMDFGDEVQTASFLWNLLEEGRENSFVVPFCQDAELEAWRIFSPEELEPGIFGIPEPTVALRAEPERFVSPESLDFVLVPGLAFDENGRRLGRGKGYYDRFLARLDPTALTVALAFECQMFDRIPVDEHDRPVSAIVTENRTILPLAF